MKPRVFVVMPFGKKQVETRDGTKTLDYNELYCKLLEPALKAADCEPFRADQESAAGDIRSDMFFELVTADAVLADVSNGNPNVFYELGVRHGVAPRGAFMVHGGWADFRPFDLAPDRTFSYDGQIFLTGMAPDPQALQTEVDRLAASLRNALMRDRTTIGSPVYNTLPGLQAADWRGVQTARFSYFSGVLDDWKQRVRIARKNGHPGDILTLAEDAPTRYHREELLVEAARGLMDLCRFGAAESVLREILALNPNNFDAQCWLGMVLGRTGKLAQAEVQLDQALKVRPDDPEAQAKLARLYKQMWRTSWEQKPTIHDRQSDAIKNVGFASSAIKGYYAGLTQDVGSYFNGINVLVLSALLAHLAAIAGEEIAELPAIDRAELTSVVSFGARMAQKNRGEEIWAAATLGILAVLAGNVAEARRRMRPIAGSPELTPYQRQSVLDDLALIRSLDFQPEATGAALSAFPEVTPKTEFNRAFVFSGHMIDAVDRPSARFPEEKVGPVRDAITRHLERWGVGKGDIALSGAAKGGDILFAEICRERGAHVRLLLAESAATYVEDSVRGGDSSWQDRFFSLRETSEVRVQPEDLGRPPESVSAHARNNLWLLNTARVEAPIERLFALLVWDQRIVPGLHGTGHFAERVRKLAGRLEIINPLGL